jgi:hypothetical protein
MLRQHRPLSLLHKELAILIHNWILHCHVVFLSLLVRLRSWVSLIHLVQNIDILVKVKESFILLLSLQLACIARFLLLLL